MRRSSVIKSSKGKVVGKAKICVCKVGRIESLDPLNFAISRLRLVSWFPHRSEVRKIGWVSIDLSH